ncbi:carboxypeptidase [Flavihumibacter rivuli]|uniref:S10 family peptidase n=1 Tax=Flavihumibacter rivuli TaxID=2838156 RepID=UPI001BDEE975|nr:carboxypeptidase [Flavihumibacter rivuli]ULQ57358.1 carboxypeptidase [Flavihumibacter rivuli]
MRIVRAFLSLFLLPVLLYAQKDGGNPPGVEAVVTRNFYTSGNKRIDYTAYSGYLDLKNDTGKLVAKVFFVYYRKDGDPAEKRPITFTFNGGPGSSSVWLHMGGLGPKRVLLEDDGTSPKPPYKYINNEYCWLDKTDLVFIDPVSTGYSRPAPGEKAGQFHGFNEDISSVGTFINMFLSRYERWASPKFLAGESYGTTRAAGLSKFLQDRYRIYLNGIFLISPVLNFGTSDYYIGNDLPRALYLPTYTATAWYHKKLSPALQANLQQAIRESKDFALGEYATALLKGGWLAEEEKDKVATKLAYYSGLSKEYWLQANLRVEENRFYKELRRKDGLTIGRLDGRFTGRDLDDAGEYYSFDPSFVNIDASFTTALNSYFQKELNLKEEKIYNIFGNVYPWNYNNVQNQFLNVAESLRDAISKNPHLKVYVGCGYYDFATPFFIAQYDVEHMFLRPELRKNVVFHFYESGHMYYIHKPSLVQFKKDVDAFFDSSSNL